MGTSVHPLTQQYANDCAALPDYPSSVNSGIAGDQTHYDHNTYHIAVHHLPVKGGYTNTWSKDKVGPPKEQYAAAIDQSMSTADMKKEWGRYKAVFDDPSDPRRDAVAEYIGTSDGVNARRLDFADGSIDSASDDHTWHSHEGGWRVDVDNAESYRKRLSIRKGETKQQYMGQGKGETDVVMLAQWGSNTGVWKSNGFECETVPTEKAVRDLMAMGANAAKVSTYYNSGGKPFASEAEMFQTIGNPKQPVDVEVSDEQIDQIVSGVVTGVVAALPDGTLSAADFDRIKTDALAAAKQALREGSGTSVQ
jgi:hypothetical protein